LFSFAALQGLGVRKLCHPEVVKHDAAHFPILSHELQKICTGIEIVVCALEVLPTTADAIKNQLNTPSVPKWFLATTRRTDKKILGHVC
jgi:hypothetical protein